VFIINDFFKKTIQETVYDVLGHVVKTASFKIGSNNNTVDLSSLAKGVYFIHLQSKGTAITKNIIVE
jgi:hypothetical protein